MANLESVFKKNIQKQTHPTRKTSWIHYTKLKQSKYQYRDRDRETVRDFADIVKMDGQILQNLVVRKLDIDEYEIISGHKRHAAATLLTEEDKLEEYAFLPCMLVDSGDIRTRFSVISTNSFDEKTPYELMHEIEEAAYLIENFPEEFPDIPEKGRLVEKLACKLKMKKSTIGEYRAIAKSLSDKGMEAFEKGDLGKSAAHTLSRLTPEEQEEVLEQGIITNKEIKDYKEKKENVPKFGTTMESEDDELTVPGQLKIINVDMEVQEDDTQLLPREKPLERNGINKSRYHIDLPVMKNMDQREEFLRNYKEWNIWTTNQYTEETFYRLDLPDDSYIVVRHFPYSSYWGGAEKHEGSTYYLMTEDKKFFKDGETNMTQLKEHLKAILRK
ncbi:hypothetical protein M2454_000758 [Aequitasia blattaphilus]|uniref:ParB N-terminal domain-containing protein n=1 Tax=Aequitasia blattaphilus TaxID=2949332 RepID=A0ABT1E812_9FIRM|nr:ParB N-terminal domain-containing protein [Aequitasia blattaphilus]MCP1101965.1 ParB N-terminal domain-containing protein [Aequitasia blattaphilus]MCR8614605.1 ParB N-terminal domain-containing protein [Aequitasia blattaphilus]